MNLRQLARGQTCQIRLPGICNYNPETTVLAHYRLLGLSGMGFKNYDLIAAWACSNCHAYVDTHKDDSTCAAFAEGVFRTQAKIIDMGERSMSRSHLKRVKAIVDEALSGKDTGS